METNNDIKKGMDALKKEKIEKGMTMAMLMCVFIFLFACLGVGGLMMYPPDSTYSHFNSIDTIIERGDTTIIIDVPQSEK